MLAIHLCREVHGTGLKTAKEAVDELASRLGNNAGKTAGAEKGPARQTQKIKRGLVLLPERSLIRLYLCLIRYKLRQNNCK